jgi:hypothetical protein
MIQGARPASLANALADSPAGLAGWIVEKFHEWSDCDGDIEARFSKDDLLTNVMIYWTTGTIGSSFLPYRDFTKAGAVRWRLRAAGWVATRQRPVSRSSPKTLPRRRAHGQNASSMWSAGARCHEAAI